MRIGNKVCIWSSLLLAMMMVLSACGQATVEETLERMNKGTVSYISAESLHEQKSANILDTRKRKEFEVSHLPVATWVGYKKFDITNVEAAYPDKTTPLVVYCSVGVRSEKIGEQLIKAGYTDVKNLYGGIFEWKNKGYPVYDPNGNSTEKVHAYNRWWGRLLKNAEKIY